MRRWIKVAAPLAILCGLVLVTGRRTCAWTEGQAGGGRLSALSDGLKSAYINFVLSPGEGPLFRTACDKRNVLIYVGNELEAGRHIAFDASYLVDYIVKERYRGEGGLAVISSDIANALDRPDLNRRLQSASRLDPDLASFLSYERLRYRMYGFRWAYNKNSIRLR